VIKMLQHTPPSLLHPATSPRACPASPSSPVEQESGNPVPSLQESQASPLSPAAEDAREPELRKSPASPCSGRSVDAHNADAQGVKPSALTSSKMFALLYAVSCQGADDEVIWQAQSMQAWTRP